MWKQKSWEVGEVVAFARVALNQWIKSQEKTFDDFLSQMTNEDGCERWTLPKENSVKINCDAAIFDAPSSFNSALVVRNNASEVRKAYTKCYMGRVLLEVAEAMRVREALSWKKEQQCSNVVIETDCLVVV